MATILRMPEVAANATHATLVQWVRAEGDSISIGESIAEIETDKAVIEIGAQGEGILAKILVKAGTDVAVGAAIAVLLAPGESLDAAQGLLGQTTERGSPGASVLSANSPPGEVAAAAKPTTASATTFEDAPVSSRRIFSSPVARLLARQNGIDLARVRGSGPNGRVVKYDVMLAVAAIGAGSVNATGAAMTRVVTASAQVATSVPSSRGAAASEASPWTEIPHTNMRRTIARRLVESKSTVPHFYLTADCRVDRLVALRAELNEDREQSISLNDFVLRAAALALREVPAVNVAWSENALLQFERVDLALAVSTPGGLMTPIIRDAASRSLLEISVEARRLAERARAGQLRAEEFQGGGFCVSNLGMYGVEAFAAIINPPQAGILAVAAVRAQPVVNADGQLAVGHIMRCTLSVDHRAVDGALAATWLETYRRLVETPVALLI